MAHSAELELAGPLHRRLVLSAHPGGADRPARLHPVCAGTDMVATGAPVALREAGLDAHGGVSLIGLDDAPFAPPTSPRAGLSPALTTVRAPCEDPRRTAIRWARGREGCLAGDDPRGAGHAVGDPAVGPRALPTVCDQPP